MNPRYQSPRLVLTLLALWFVMASCVAPLATPNAPSALSTPSQIAPPQPTLSQTAQNEQPTPTETRRPALVPATRTLTPTVRPRATVPPLVRGYATIELGDSYFYPTLITVTVGTKVHWDYIGELVHGIQAEDGSFGQRLVSQRGAYEFTFAKVGVFRYMCSFHQTAMQATVVVVPEP